MERTMNQYAPTKRTTVVRHPERARYEKDVVEQILDKALICHIGFVVEGQPYVIPAIHARRGDRRYLHGSSGRSANVRYRHAA